MKKFIFVVHNHQPVGNFDEVIRTAFEKSYKPFIDLVYELKYPKVCFHFSAILYQWLSKNNPQYISKLKEMVERDQIEILSGGYYEPILSVIPKKDAIAQVKKMNNYISQTFGYTPKGLWLTERVWEDSICDIISNCGIEYTLVDDSHLHTSLISDNEVNNCFLTEYDGSKTNIFIIDHNLRYLIPYKPPYQTLQYLNSKKDGIFVFADDGEKFGLWPESYKLVYEEKWLLNFFETIKNSDVKMVRLSDCFNEIKNMPRKLVYMADSSYFEMTKWALNYDDANKIDDFKKSVSKEFEKFVRGGVFKNFFSKYIQSSLIHRRNFYVSNMLKSTYNPIAEDYLHKAQCNCGWWHGVFGGIYLVHIRMAIYENLLKAQKLIYDKSDFIDFKKYDMDMDGVDEIVVESKNNFFVISPSYGGAIMEFSSKNRCVNYSAVMDRYKESYHFKEIFDINGKRINSIVDNSSFYDWHHRFSLLDHFVSPDTTLDSFLKVFYNEVGDFIPQPYDYKVEVDRNRAVVYLERNGVIDYRDKKIDVLIKKKIEINSDKDGFKVSYTIKNNSQFEANIVSVNEFSFVFSDINVAPLRDVDNISEYIFYDNIYGNMKISFSIPLRLWIFPIETLSNSESGVEKTYQGSVIGCVLNRNYKIGEEFSFDVEVSIL